MFYHVYKRYHVTLYFHSKWCRQSTRTRNYVRVDVDSGAVLSPWESDTLPYEPYDRTLVKSV